MTAASIVILRLLSVSTNSKRGATHMKSYKALAALTFLMSGPAVAAEQSIASVDITGIRAFSDGTFYLTLSSHGSCTNTATPKRFFSVAGTLNGVVTNAEGVKSLYALALAAYT